MTAVDWQPDSNINRVATYAAELGDRIREEDPREMFEHLERFCAGHPAKAAQLLMVFAAWFDPDEETSVLVARARDITASRVASRLGMSA